MTDVRQKRSKGKETMAMRGNGCPNFNHRHRNAPVRFCSMCGEVVNKDIPAIECDEQKHARQRRNRHKYCVDCGELLIPEALAMR